MPHDYRTHVPEPDPADASAPVGNGRPSFDLSRVLHSIGRWKVTFLLIGTLAATTAGWMAWTRVPDRRPATAVLHISVHPEYVFQTASESQIDLATYRQRQQLEVKSKRVLEAVFLRPEVQALPLAQSPTRVEALERAIQIDFKLGPEFMRITVEGDSPADSLVLVAAIRDVYLAEIVQKERRRVEGAVASKERVSREWAEELNRLRVDLDRQLAEFHLTHADIPQIPLLQRRDLDLHALHSRELRQVRFRIEQLRGEISPAQGKDADMEPVPGEQVAEELAGDATYKALQAKTRELEQVLTANEAFAKPGADIPALNDLRAAIEAARKAEEDYKSASVERVTSRIRMRARLERALVVTQRQRELTALEDWERTLAAETERLDVQAARLTKAAFALDSFNQKTVRLEKQIEEGRVAIERQRLELLAPFRVTTQDEPTLTPVNDLGRRMKFAALAAMASLAFVGAAVVGYDLRRDRISHPDQIADSLDVRVLGAIPTVSSRARVLTGEADETAEATDIIRTMLLHNVTSPAHRVILVASAAPGEGKTTLSLGLAASLARAGYRTLLVDGDLRKPGLHVALGMGLTPGLADLLRTPGWNDSHVLSPGGLGFNVLTAGTAPHRATTCLAGPEWEQFLGEARERYDFVILDSSPVLAAVDPVLMARGCDGLVLTVISEVSRFGPVSEAVARLRRLNLPIAGCVVHGCPRPTYGRYPRLAPIASESAI